MKLLISTFLFWLMILSIPIDNKSDFKFTVTPSYSDQDVKLNFRCESNCAWNSLTVNCALPSCNLYVDYFGLYSREDDRINLSQMYILKIEFESSDIKIVCQKGCVWSKTDSISIIHDFELSLTNTHYDIK